MSYRKRLDLGEPDAEQVEQSRRITMWLLPILVLQQAWLIFRDDGSAFAHYLGIAAWAAVILVEVAMLGGWKFRWLSERDNAILNDEWHRTLSGEASRWGIAAVAVLGIGLLATDRWITLDPAITVFVLVNAAMAVAALRYAWLNRGSAVDDA